MSDEETDPTIRKALERISISAAEVVRWKLLVNHIDELHDRPPRFADVNATDNSHAAAPAAGRSPIKWSPGSFYNASFSGAVRKVLEARYVRDAQSAPASVDEIHDALGQGSFDFGTAGAENQKNSIRISLGKNSTTFVKLPSSELFGLVEWYGARVKKAGRKSAEPAAGATSGEAAAEAPAAESNAEQTEGRE